MTVIQTCNSSSFTNQTLAQIGQLVTTIDKVYAIKIR